MNLYDIAIVIIVGASAIFGARSGLVPMLMSFLTLLLALLAALNYSDHVAAWLADFVAHETARGVAAFALLFVGVVIAGRLATAALAKLVDWSGLRTADMVAGAVFGLLRGLLIVMLALLLAEPWQGESATWQESRIIPPLAQLMEQAWHWELPFSAPWEAP